MEIRLLGPLEVEVDGRRVDLGPLKERTLLGVLLLHANETVSTERLIDELWGGDPAPSAPKLVQTYVSHLRKALPDLIETRPPGYALRVEPDALDVTRFERLVARATTQPPELAAATLREALALWRGRALEGLSFESFAAQEVERLEDSRVSALAARVDADLALGRHDELVRELQALVARHPYRERFRAQLMLALYRSGRQADALAVYTDARGVLADELGLEPGPELRAVQASILQQADEAPAPPPARPAPARRRMPRAVAAAAAAVALVAVAVAAGAVLAQHASTPRSVAVAAPSVAAVDARTGAVVADVPLAGTPTRVATSPGAVWVVDSSAGTLTRIDPQTRRVVRTIAIGDGVTDVATTPGAVWVLAAGDRRLVRVDPNTNRIVARVPTAIGSAMAGGVPRQAATIAASGDDVFVNGVVALWKVDARTNRIVGSLAPTGGFAGVTAERGKLWTVDTRSVPGAPVVVTGRDIATGARFADEQLTDTIVGAATVGGTSFLAQLDGSLIEVDALSGVIAGSTRVAQRPSAIVAAGGSIWIADADAHALVRVDTDGRVRRRIALAAEPGGVATDGATLWVTFPYAATASANAR